MVEGTFAWLHKLTTGQRTMFGQNLLSSSDLNFFLTEFIRLKYNIKLYEEFISNSFIALDVATHAGAIHTAGMCCAFLNYASAMNKFSGLDPKAEYPSLKEQLIECNTNLLKAMPALIVNVKKGKSSEQFEYVVNRLKGQSFKASSEVFDYDAPAITLDLVNAWVHLQQTIQVLQALPPLSPLPEAQLTAVQKKFDALKDYYVEKFENRVTKRIMAPQRMPELAGALDQALDELQTTIVTVLSKMIK
eukprot:Colp12_sorted_trinity150504_noHs@36011